MPSAIHFSRREKPKANRSVLYRSSKRGGALFSLFSSRKKRAWKDGRWVVRMHVHKRLPPAAASHCFAELAKQCNGLPLREPTMKGNEMLYEMSFPDRKSANDFRDKVLCLKKMMVSRDDLPIADSMIRPLRSEVPR